VVVDDKVDVRPSSSLSSFPTNHKEPISSLCFNQSTNSGSAFIISAAQGSVDTSIKCWSLSGSLLASVNTSQIINYMATVTSDDLHVLVATKVGGGKAYALGRSAKNGPVDSIKLATTLKGHIKPVKCISNSSGSYVATCSEDGSWRLYDFNVKIKLQEDPKLISSVTVGESCEVVDVRNGTLSNVSSGVVAVGTVSGALLVYDIAGKLLCNVPNAHKGAIRDLWITDAVTNTSSSSSSSSVQLSNLLFITLGDEKTIKCWTCNQ